MKYLVAFFEGHYSVLDICNHFQVNNLVTISFSSDWKVIQGNEIEYHCALISYNGKLSDRLLGKRGAKDIFFANSLAELTQKTQTVSANYNADNPIHALLQTMIGLNREAQLAIIMTGL